MNESARPTRTTLEALDDLFKAAAAVRYPSEVTPTWARIENAEFFPGGYGLWLARAGEPLPELPIGGVLVLGHNLDCVESFAKNLAKGGANPDTQPTFRNLKRLLDASGIPVSNVFLTNFFMGCGLMQTGAFPGRNDRNFVSDCADLLRRTLHILQPRTVIVLGKETWRHLGAVAPGLGAWAKLRTFSALDKLEHAQVLGPLSVDGGPPFKAVAVVHPSYAPSNWKHRRYAGRDGLGAEAELLRLALARVP